MNFAITSVGGQPIPQLHSATQARPAEKSHQQAAVKLPSEQGRRGSAVGATAASLSLVAAVTAAAARKSRMRKGLRRTILRARELGKAGFPCTSAGLTDVEIMRQKLEAAYNADLLEPRKDAARYRQKADGNDGDEDDYDDDDKEQKPQAAQKKQKKSVERNCVQKKSYFDPAHRFDDGVGNTEKGLEALAWVTSVLGLSAYLVQEVASYFGHFNTEDSVLKPTPLIAVLLLLRISNRRKRRQRQFTRRHR